MSRAARLNINPMLVRFLTLLVLAMVPNFVFAQDATLPKAVEDCHAKLAVEYNKGEMKYKDWLIKYRQCYVDNGASNLIPESLNVYATPENTFDNNFATADCVVEAQRWYTKEITRCLEKTPVAQYQSCYEGELLEEFKKKNATCYQNSSFGGVWDLPVLKQALVGQFNDFQNLSTEKSRDLGLCLEKVSQNFDLKKVSAKAQEAISQCFLAAGLKGVADVYAKTAIVVDCATMKWPITTAVDVRRVAAGQSAEDKAYLEQCVMNKVAPAAVGTAAASIPLATGWRTLFLFGQLVVTQPLVLIRRRKYKTWGTVFDTATTQPVDLGTVRLVQTERNKVISTAVTNKQGQYLFLPAPSTYRVEVDKPGYVFPSTLLTRGAYERDHYFGEPIAVKTQHDVIDRHIPVDPHTKAISVWKFNLRRWRYRAAVVFGFISPIISLAGFIILRTWWLGLFVLAHALIFGIFFRLSLRNRARKFGVVRDKHNKPIANATVYLFRVGDKKLLNYYVTDWFGRYYFPRLVGDYTIVVNKNGYVKKEVGYSVKHDDPNLTTIKIDVILDKK